ncbi:DUF6440 family protein [Rothia terrae]|uniref:DUF6440 family protein n=1 Tax=Rothia terrae TaxID=396015 RepID=UPI00381F1065
MFNKTDSADKRFILNDKQEGITGGLRVLTDSHTGMQYLVVRENTGVAVTPLLNADGKPLVAGAEDRT